jgi:hypothetical protein
MKERSFARFVGWGIGNIVENPICSMELEDRLSAGWHPPKCDLSK